MPFSRRARTAASASALGVIPFSGRRASSPADTSTDMRTTFTLSPHLSPQTREEETRATVPADATLPPPSPPPMAATVGLHLTNLLHCAPMRHTDTAYGASSLSRPRAGDYGELSTNKDPEAGSSGFRSSDGELLLPEDGFSADEDVPASYRSPRGLLSQYGRQRKRRRRWAACRVACSLFLLVVLLVLNVLLLVLRPTGYAMEADPDEIFHAWGYPGTGTSDLAWYPTDFLRDVVPIPCHSHNDYWRYVPLFSGLHAGCVGTEADVWLIGDDLYVGHKRSALSSNRTFQSLYVNPLVQILEHQNPTTAFYNASLDSARANGVFDMRPNQTLALLVDVKTEGDATFRKVLEQVEPLRKRGWLSTFEDGQVKYGPVTLVGTGNTPFDVVVENGTYRFAFFDAPLAQLENSVYDMTNSYYASEKMSRAVGQLFFGALRRSQLQRIDSQLQQAHARGLKARYWDLPAWPVSVRDHVWTSLVEEGIDLLNVDDIQSAAHQDWSKGGRKNT